MQPAKNLPWIQSYDSSLKWDITIEPKPVFAMLDDTVVRFGDRPGFDFLGKKLSWGEIGALSDRLARALQDMGFGKGHKVGLFLPNCSNFVIAYYGVLKSGATVVNYNPLYAERELVHQIEDSETDVLITCDLALLYDKAIKMLNETRLKNLVVCRFTDMLGFPKNILFPIVKKKDMASVAADARIVWMHEITQNDGAYKRPSIDPYEDVAVLQYTGGTTGVPKGAMLTHMNIYANTVQSQNWFPDVQMGQEKMLGVLPFFHVFAMTTVMNFSVLSGLEIVALPRFDLNDTLKLIHKKKPHYLPAVPAIYNAINNHPKLADYDLSSLRYCISGGAPLPVEVKKSFEANTGCIVIEGYGLTESSPVVCGNPIHGENKAGSIGMPIPQTIVEIIDPDDKKTIKAVGERGELCVSGPQVMKGYWKKPEASADVLRAAPDGRIRLHTGDVAIMDENGYVYIVDRIKDMIITNGYNVYPRNVEEVIYLHPNVEECIVAGIPDPERGEIVKAWIKCKTGRPITEFDLKEFLSDKLSPMEMPRKIEFRTEPLPKTMIGKLSRKDILAQEKAS